MKRFIVAFFSTLVQMFFSKSGPSHPTLRHIIGNDSVAYRERVFGMPFINGFVYSPLTVGGSMEIIISMLESTHGHPMKKKHSLYRILLSMCTFY